MHAYRIRNLTKTYRKGQVVANRDLNLDIEQGEIFGLLGPNGAGKTTLVRQLAALLAPTSGTIELFGRDLSRNVFLVPRLVSYVTQRPGALADLTPMEALEITGRLRGMARAGAAAQARSLAEEFGLGALGKRVLGKLSGGEQRLVSFCLAMMGDRPLMILDEPTNDLDPTHRRQLWDKLVELNQTKGTTVVLVTHNVIEAERVLQRVGIIDQGKVVALGGVGELKAKVDQRVRLEFRARPGEATDRCLEALTSLGGLELRQVSRGQWQALAPRDAVSEVVAALLDSGNGDLIDDFRVLTATLEDVYIQLGGGGRLAREGAEAGSDV